MHVRALSKKRPANAAVEDTIQTILEVLTFISTAISVFKSLEGVFGKE
ncbi:MAG: hypothetical protein QG656_1517 [Candidatus Hydrogenedentes bacterium]|jgi:hypothetical protein|nr:hypothetical protein [Candidatus Hydrogenedentota bacterium]